MDHAESDVDAVRVPPTNKALLTVAALLLAIPVVALLWVGSYARIEPVLAGFPFFIWYKFLWVFLCAACTWAAHRIVLIARPRRPLSGVGRSAGRQADEYRHQLSRAGGADRPVLAGHGHGFLGVQLAPRRTPGKPGRMGSWGTHVRHVDHLVSARRRPLHSVHVRGGAAAMFALARSAVSLPFRTPSSCFPIIFIYMSRLWSVSYRHGYVTAADFVRGRYGSKECPWPLRSPASLPPCRTSHSNSSVFRRSSKWSALAVRTTSSRRICRCSSRSHCSPPIPTLPACALRR